MAIKILYMYFSAEIIQTNKMKMYTNLREISQIPFLYVNTPHRGSLRNLRVNSEYSVPLEIFHFSH